MSKNRKSSTTGIAEVQEDGMTDAIPEATTPVAEETAKPARTKKPTRLTEEAILAKYSHAVAGTLVFETEGHHKGKQTIEADLPCGHRERIATSDLFQVKRCKECKKPAPRAPKAEKPAVEKKSKRPNPADYNKPIVPAVSFVPAGELADLTDTVA